jgi:pheromone shutdown protein TraB
MSHTLLLTSKQIQKPNPVIVAVVGMGHVPGISKNFGGTSEGEFLRVAR